MVPFQKLFRQRQLKRIVVDQQAIDFAPTETAGLRFVLFDRRGGRQCLHFRFLQRQDDHKIAAFSRNALQRQRPSHQLDQLAGDGKPEAETFFLFGFRQAGELAENLLLLLFRNSDAGVGDGNGQLRIDN